MPMLEGKGGSWLVQARACAGLQAQPAAAVEHRATVRALQLTAQRAVSAHAQAEALEKELRALVKAVAPVLLAQPGVGPITAAQVLISWSHPGRLCSEAAFAMLAGVAPIQASSGRVVRHRLNRGGDRQLNRTLHTIVMIRQRYHQPTKGYQARRSGQGKTEREIRRCLTRAVARQLFRLPRAPRRQTGPSGRAEHRPSHVNAAALVSVGIDVTDACGMPLARSRPGGWLLVCIALLLAACTSQRDRPSAAGAPAHPTTTSSRAQAELDLQLTRQLPRQYRLACARVSSYQPLAADACPPLVPQGTIDISSQGSPRGWPRSYQLDLASSSLNQIGGRPVQTNGGHWTVAAARGRANQRLLTFQLRPPNATRPSTCRHIMLQGGPVTACRVPPYEQGGGFYGDHIAYAWRHRDVVYHITIHGYANEPRVRLMMAALIARETRR